MHWLQILPLTAADENPSASFFKEQKKCVQKLFLLDDAQIKSSISLPRIGRAADKNDVCTWFGIECVHQVVRTFTVPQILYDIPRVYLIAWFPSTLREISATSLRLNQAIHTRNLPRDLEHLSMVECGLIGGLDLQTLPPILFRMRLSMNSICGAILLANIPKSLVIIHLQHTDISRVYVSMRDVHSGFFELHVNNPRHRQGKIEVKVLTHDARNVSSCVSTGSVTRYEYELMKKPEISRTHSRA